MCMCIYMNTMKDGEKKADWLGTLGPKELHGSKFLGFSFCLMYPIFRAEESGNAEMSMGMDRKPSAKACFLQPKDQKRSSLAKQNIFT